MIHFFTQGTAEHVNALFAQLKQYVKDPFVLHCLTNEVDGYSPYIQIHGIGYLYDYQWPEEYYSTLCNEGVDVIAVIPSNIYLLPDFNKLVEKRERHVCFPPGGMVYVCPPVPTEGDRIRYDSFEKWISTYYWPIPVVGEFYRELPAWFDRKKDLIELLYDESIGLYAGLPNKLHIELTDSCFLKCPVCVQTDYENKEKSSIFVRGKQLTIGDIKKIVSPKFIQDSHLEHVELCGNLGEPTQATDLLSICDYFCSNGVLLTLITNGMKSEPGWWNQLATIFAKAPGSVVIFGIDGATAETHERIRPGANFDQIIANATTFIENGGQAFWKFVYWGQSYGEIQEAKRMCKELKFFDFIFIGNEPSPPAEPIVQAPVESVPADPRPRVAPLVQIETVRARTASPTYQERKIKTSGKVRCKAKIENRAYIDAAGNVFPCSMTALEMLKEKVTPIHNVPFAYNWDLNNAKNVPLEEILRNEFFTRYMTYSLQLDPTLFCRQQCGR
jgi:MoaA/NifB/PqqE/SkfB family radical SAM enzyme